MTADQAALTAYLLDPCLSVNEARRMAAAAARPKDAVKKDVNRRPVRPKAPPPAEPKPRRV